MFVLFFVLIISISSPSSSSEGNEEINTAAQTRFDEILAVMPELDSITCLDGNCTSVVYFNFNTEPVEGFDMIIRGNTATFSQWKLNQTGTSHVSIFGMLNGQTVLQCDGSKGVVDSCF